MFYPKPVQINVGCFHRVSGGLNLAVRFNARLAAKMSVVALATIEKKSNYSIVANATGLDSNAFRALKHTAKFTTSLRDELCPVFN